MLFYILLQSNSKQDEAQSNPRKRSRTRSSSESEHDSFYGSFVDPDNMSRDPDEYSKPDEEELGNTLDIIYNPTRRGCTTSDEQNNQISEQPINNLDISLVRKKRAQPTGVPESIIQEQSRKQSQSTVATTATAAAEKYDVQPQEDALQKSPATNSADETELMYLGQLWDLNGPADIALLSVTPTELATQNSMVTANAEAQNRKIKYDMGFDLAQNPMSDEVMRHRYKDGAVMVEVRRAFIRGKYNPPPDTSANPAAGQADTMDEDDCQQQEDASQNVSAANSEAKTANPEQAETMDEYDGQQQEETLSLSDSVESFDLNLEGSTSLSFSSAEHDSHNRDNKNHIGFNKNVLGYPTDPTFQANNTLGLEEEDQWISVCDKALYHTDPQRDDSSCDCSAIGPSNNTSTSLFKKSSPESSAMQLLYNIVHTDQNEGQALQCIKTFLDGHQRLNRENHAPRLQNKSSVISLIRDLTDADQNNCHHVHQLTNNQGSSNACTMISLLLSISTIKKSKMSSEKSHDEDQTNNRLNVLAKVVEDAIQQGTALWGSVNAKSIEGRINSDIGLEDGLKFLETSIFDYPIERDTPELAPMSMFSDPFQRNKVLMKFNTEAKCAAMCKSYLFLENGFVIFIPSHF